MSETNIIPVPVKFIEIIVNNDSITKLINVFTDLLQINNVNNVTSTSFNSLEYYLLLTPCLAILLCFVNLFIKNKQVNRYFYFIITSLFTSLIIVFISMGNYAFNFLTDETRKTVVVFDVLIDFKMIIYGLISIMFVFQIIQITKIILNLNYNINFKIEHK
jgi:hypothetical protein